MRNLLLSFLCIFFFTGHAQTYVPIGGNYVEKFYFIDSNNFFHRNAYPVIADSLMKLEKMAQEANDEELAGELRLLRYNRGFHEQVFNLETAEGYLKGMIAIAQRDSLHYLEADIWQALGNMYMEAQKKMSEGIEDMISSYELYRNFESDAYPPKQKNLYELGGAFYGYGDYDNAIKYFKQALLAKKSRNNNLYCSIFNTIGLCYRQQEIYDSALGYFQKTHDVAASLNNRAWEGIAMGNIGITYFHEHKYDQAIPLLQNDIELSITTNNLKNGVGSIAILATIYNEQNEHNKARRVLDTGINIARSKYFWHDYVLKEELFTQLYKVFAADRDYEMAYKYADSALMAKDSAVDNNTSLSLAKAHEKLNYMQHKLEVAQLQTEAKLQKSELGKRKIEMIFTFIGIAVLLGVIIFIARERKRTETLLLNILPAKIAERLKRKEHPIADYFENASIIFIDIAGFTEFADRRDPKEVVTVLNTVFTKFDALAERNGLEKIKTIGDCYMAVSGVPEPNPNHAEAAVRMALDIRSQIQNYTTSDGEPIAFRIGLDCGPIVAGVIGSRKFIYDLWGDTVNTASRMETTGVAGEIHCTDRFKNNIGKQHTFVSRGDTEIKGKGVMATWLVVS